MGLRGGEDQMSKLISFFTQQQTAMAENLERERADRRREKREQRELEREREGRAIARGERRHAKLKRTGLSRGKWR